MTTSTDPHIRDYLVLEQDLIRRVTREWINYAGEIQAKLSQLIDEKKWAQAADLAHSVSMKGVAKASREYAKQVFMACALHGARMVNPRAQFLSVLSNDDLMDHVADTFVMSLQNNGTQAVVDSALQSIATALKETSQQVHKAERYLKNFVSFASAGKDSIQLTSSLHTSRLATWGFTAEADATGVTQYVISAVLDGRTSEFCRWINGKTFAVEDAKRSINAVLQVQDPNDLKTVQPWPNQSKDSLDELKALKANELVARNLHIPPYHPGCRTMLVRKGAVPRMAKPSRSSTSQQPQQPFATADDFSALKMPVSASELDHWNAYVGCSPTTFLSMLTGTTGKDLLDGKLGGKLISLADSGDISFMWKTSGDAVSGRYAVTFDPIMGNLMINTLKLKVGSMADATVALRQFYMDMVDTARYLEADTLSAGVQGETALSYAKMGFAPSAAKWTEMRLEMLDALPPSFLLLPDSLQATITTLLNTKDESAAILLASLSGAGKFLSDLFRPYAYTASFDLTNKDAVSHLMAVLS